MVYKGNIIEVQVALQTLQACVIKMNDTKSECIKRLIEARVQGTTAENHLEYLLSQSLVAKIFAAAHGYVVPLVEGDKQIEKLKQEISVIVVPLVEGDKQIEKLKQEISVIVAPLIEEDNRIEKRKQQFKGNNNIQKVKLFEPQFKQGFYQINQAYADNIQSLLSENGNKAIAFYNAEKAERKSTPPQGLCVNCVKIVWGDADVTFQKQLAITCDKIGKVQNEYIKKLQAFKNEQIIRKKELEDDSERLEIIKIIQYENIEGLPESSFNRIFRTEQIKSSEQGVRDASAQFPQQFDKIVKADGKETNCMTSGTVRMQSVDNQGISMKIFIDKLIQVTGIDLNKCYENFPRELERIRSLLQENLAVRPSMQQVIQSPQAQNVARSVYSLETESILNQSRVLQAQVLAQRNVKLGDITDEYSEKLTAKDTSIKNIESQIFEILNSALQFKPQFEQMKNNCDKKIEGLKQSCIVTKYRFEAAKTTPEDKYFLSQQFEDYYIQQLHYQNQYLIQLAKLRNQIISYKLKQSTNHALLQSRNESINKIIDRYDDAQFIERNKQINDLKQEIERLLAPQFSLQASRLAYREKSHQLMYENFDIRDNVYLAEVGEENVWLHRLDDNQAAWMCALDEGIKQLTKIKDQALVYSQMQPDEASVQQIELEKKDPKYAHDIIQYECNRQFRLLRRENTDLQDRIIQHTETSTGLDIDVSKQAKKIEISAYVERSRIKEKIDEQVELFKNADVVHEQTALLNIIVALYNKILDNMKKVKKQKNELFVELQGRKQ